MRYFSFFLLITLLFLMSGRFFLPLPIRESFLTNEAYIMRFLWLDSVNTYLESGKILMIDDKRLEDVNTGEDQGYPLILSMIGSSFHQKQMTLKTFVLFNYAFFLFFGLISSLLLYFTFRSILISSLFYFIYLTSGIYTGGLDHHWTLGALIPFYISCLIFIMIKHSRISFLSLVPYFLIAGTANIIREGNGVVGILLFISSLMIYVFFHHKRHSVIKVRKLFLYALLFIFLYSLPEMLLAAMRSQRDQMYFNNQKSVMITHHGLWHNAFMGLGYIPNPYGIKWADSNNLSFVRTVNPKANYMTNEYYDILQKLYIEYSLKSPLYWVQNYAAKIAGIHLYSETILPPLFLRFFPFRTGYYSLYIFLLGLIILAKKSRVIAQLTLFVLSALIISSLPAIIGMPSTLYLEGFHSAYLMTIVYFFAALLIRIKKTIHSYV